MTRKSNIADISFIHGDTDGDTGTLYFTLHGVEMVYRDVPATVARDFRDADSKGGFFNRTIRPNYRNA